ncbi:M23 family metallopeptidase [Streptomyces sp. 3N207]|uniref:M23 family metallopeptidase n=1 Tax=Streptomyces sp. 3N207 TaxID=3457417 RepID=UPI003FD02D00
MTSTVTSSKPRTGTAQRRARPLAGITLTAALLALPTPTPAQADSLPEPSIPKTVTPVPGTPSPSLSSPWPGGSAGESAGEAGGGARRAWVRPLALSRVRVSQPYGVPGSWAAGYHTGIDLAVREGTPVRSVGPGTVVHAGWAGAYGNAVTVRMTDGKYTLFAHLSRVFVRVGSTVRPGTWLGRSGNTGRSTGPHLHFEVRAQRGYGTDIDPVRYLARHGVRLV